MLEDVLLPGLSLVICGTAAGTRSASLKLYYACNGNKLWKTLVAVGLTPRELRPEDYPLLPSFGIGLTDIVKGQSGSDDSISFSRGGSDVVREKLLRFKPRVLCFNGKRAAQEFLHLPHVQFGLWPERVGVTKLFVAPSTSGAANALWDIKWWRQLADIVRSESA